MDGDNVHGGEAIIKRLFVRKEIPLPLPLRARRIGAGSFQGGMNTKQVFISACGKMPLRTDVSDA